jgi:hypothetical protein
VSLILTSPIIVTTSPYVGHFALNVDLTGNLDHTRWPAFYLRVEEDEVNFCKFINIMNH